MFSPELLPPHRSGAISFRVSIPQTDADMRRGPRRIGSYATRAMWLSLEECLASSDSGCTRTEDDVDRLKVPNLDRPPERSFSSVIKRTVDVVGSVGALVFFAPLMLLIAMLIWTTNPGPIFFRQARIGRGGRKFNCYKFRSMATTADELLAKLLSTDPVAREEWSRLHKLTRDPRVTPVGRVLRLSSLDELPQLLNVLRGDMSLIGPRPIVAAEIDRYGRYINDYMTVRPGVTGLWQISGRNDTTYRRRVALDVVYARRCCWQMDLWILLRTIPAVLKWDGAY
jgi:exopolysaccharide production protein ExoY